MTCCDTVYSTTDANTYWCFEKFVVDPMKKLKNRVDKDKVSREEIFTLLCKKNGCTKVILLRFAMKTINGMVRKKLLEKEDYSGKEAIEFLNKTRSVRQSVHIKSPGKENIGCEYIPLIYGKTISFEKQRARFVNEKGYPDTNIIKTESKIVRNKANIPIFEDKNWKTKVIERDNHSCILCDFPNGEKIQQLNFLDPPHHILSKAQFGRLDYEWNLITLCHKCHHEWHNSLEFRVKKIKDINQYFESLGYNQRFEAVGKAIRLVNGTL